MIIYCLLEYVSILQCRFASQVIDALKKKSLNNRCCASVLKKIGKDDGSVCVWGGGNFAPHYPGFAGMEKRKEAERDIANGCSI